MLLLILDATTEGFDLDDEQMMLSGQKKAEEIFKTLCADTLKEISEKVPALRVSSAYRHSLQSCSLEKMTVCLLA
jgi:hypothetical protein